MTESDLLGKIMVGSNGDIFRFLELSQDGKFWYYQHQSSRTGKVSTARAFNKPYLYKWIEKVADYIGDPIVL